MNCDVLVVGCGPAGAMAAAAAAKAGAGVVVVERARRVGGAVACAEFVPRAIALEFSLPARSVVQTVEGMRVVLRARSHHLPGPGFILDRRVFDHALALAAARAGARVLAGARVVGRRGQRWVVRGRWGEMEVSAGAVVGADGPASTVARAVGAGRQDVVGAVQLEVVLTQELKQTVVVLAEEFTGGYGWIFPKGQEANLGVGCRGARLWPMVNQLHEWAVELGLVGRAVVGISAGAIPVGGPRPAAMGNVLLAGDAAGLTHPLTGAGIPQALASGTEAGKAAAAIAGGRAEAGEEYAHELELRYGRYLRNGLELRRFVEEQWHIRDFQELMAQAWNLSRALRSS